MDTQMHRYIVRFSLPAPCVFTAKQRAGPVGGETTPPLFSSLHSRSRGNQPVLHRWYIGCDVSCKVCCQHRKGRPIWRLWLNQWRESVCVIALLHVVTHWHGVLSSKYYVFFYYYYSTSMLSSSLSQCSRNDIHKLHVYLQQPPNYKSPAYCSAFCHGNEVYSTKASTKPLSYNRMSANIQ